MLQRSRLISQAEWLTVLQHEESPEAASTEPPDFSGGMLPIPIKYLSGPSSFNGAA